MTFGPTTRHGHDDENDYRDGQGHAPHIEHIPHGRTDLRRINPDDLAQKKSAHCEEASFSEETDSSSSLSPSVLMLRRCIR